ncbi:hypothetical protein [Microcoleus sp. CAWBG58]|nr:hypothetical protein [Microcoleus sp. CAWBG58]
MIVSGWILVVGKGRAIAGSTQSDRPCAWLERETCRRHPQVWRRVASLSI